MVQPSFVTPQSRPTSTPECWQLLTSITPFESTTKIPAPRFFSPAIQSCGGEQNFYRIIMVALDLFDTRYTRKVLTHGPKVFTPKSPPTSAPECGQLLTSIQFESTTKIFQHLSRILFKIFLHVCDARNICDFSSCIIIIIRVENVGTTCWTSCL